MTNRPGFARSRWGAVANVSLAAVIIAATALTASMAVSRRRDPPPTPMTTRELEVALLRAQVTPDALAAMGLTGAQTTALIGRAGDALGPDIEAFRAVESAVGPARATRDRLTRLVRSGLGAPEDAAGLAAARTALSNAESALATRSAAVRGDALGEGFPSGQAATLATIAVNRAWQTLPVEYRCRSGATEAQWVRLRQALFEQRSAQRDNRQIDPSDQAVLDQWDQNPAVAAAKTNLQTRLPEVANAWNLMLR